MLARVLSASLHGIQARLVHVEVDVASGLPAFATVGLPDSTVRESRDRVRAAIKNGGFKFPDDRITVNLAPADVRKEGAAFDLPIALGVIAATDPDVRTTLDGVAVVGELALDGELRSVRGVLAIALTCRRHRIRSLLVPTANALEAANVGDVRVLPAASLREAVAILKGEIEPAVIIRPGPPTDAPYDEIDFADVRGQLLAKRAMEIAAAGGHNVLLLGPPGSGKTMLAQRLTTILPAPTHDEMIDITTIASVAGLLPTSHLLTRRPFRAPHHTISVSGLIGGGSPPHAGEVTLAHLGVLFLDELPEYQQHVLESLRQPLEDGRVTIARVAGTNRFPARFQLVAAANPCRRGCASLDRCLCLPAERQRYLGRISRPLLDRIDLHVELPALAHGELRPGTGAEISPTIRERVERARARQRDRFAGTRVRANAEMTPRHLRRFCPTPPEADRLLAAAMDRLGLSARGHDRVIKVARTIADLANSEALRVEHYAEAIQYRTLDRQWRG